MLVNDHPGSPQGVAIMHSIFKDGITSQSVAQCVRILFLQDCEDFLSTIIPVLEKIRERVAVCPDCGANRYTGEPCIKYEAR